MAEDQNRSSTFSSASSSASSGCSTSSGLGPNNRSIPSTWFHLTQVKNVRLPDGTFPLWFHGIMSHWEATSLLANQAKGCFLLRESDSQPHFTLSIKGEEPPGEEVKHYILKQTKNGNYLVIGESLSHSTIPQLIQYYHHNKLGNWDGFLTEPFSQEPS